MTKNKKIIPGFYWIKIKATKEVTIGRINDILEGNLFRTVDIVGFTWWLYEREIQILSERLLEPHEKPAKWSDKDVKKFFELRLEDHKRRQEKIKTYTK